MKVTRIANSLQKKVSEVSGVFGGFSPKAVDCYDFSGEIV